MLKNRQLLLIIILTFGFSSQWVEINSSSPKSPTIELISSDVMNILEPGDQIDIPANMKYRLLGNMSMLQTLTAMMTLYLTFLAVN